MDSSAARRPRRADRRQPDRRARDGACHAGCGSCYTRRRGAPRNSFCRNGFSRCAGSATGAVDAGACRLPRQRRRPPRPGRRARAGLPARSHRLGRPLRQQRLAAGSAEAADEAHVGHRRLDQSQACRDARPGSWRRHRAQVPRRHREDAGLHRPRPAGRDGDGLPRLRPPHGGTRRERRRPGPGVQRLPAADVRRAVVRQRSGNHEDRRALPPGDDAGPSRDGRPAPGAGQHAGGVREGPGSHPAT